MLILIVEDEKALSQVLAEKLQKEGFDIATAYDGAEAVPMAKKKKPDMILLDLLLPKKNGFEILQELKSDKSLEQIPVIVLSNLDQDEDIKKSISLGAVDYYVKAQHPLKEIVEKVKNQLVLKKK